MIFIIFLFILLMVLISVGFFTLLERKVMGFIHIRTGPMSVGYFGMFQPFSDGAKLFLKEFIWPLNSNLIIYLFCPIYSLILSLFIWILFPLFVNLVDFSFGVLFFLCCSSFSIYFLMIGGWFSNSSYSVLGGVRSISQAISYEVSLSIIFLCQFILIDGYSFLDFNLFQDFSWFLFISIPLFFCWLSCSMAESNRIPFDFSEGESELVSGFNIEYGSGGFVFLFISEYSSIIFISVLTCLIFLGGDYYSFYFFLKLILVIFFFIWVRCSFPRYRYDKLMYLAWKCYLPLSFNYLFFFVFIKSLVFYHFFLWSY
uniref:NADH dehydrogenase subunit 1 n=1 Tax=Multinervis guangxiensis TaxID=1792637 RepID=UPI003001CA1B|nr:NADH dehydrogenase subunit 1 [Multinervis guangxiensis]